MKAFLTIIALCVSYSIQISSDGSVEISVIPKKTSKRIQISAFEKAVSLKMTSKIENGGNKSVQTYSLSIRVQILDYELLVRQRLPVDIVICADISGSMYGRKLMLLKQSIYFIVDNLKPYDRIGLVTFRNKAYLRSHLIPMNNEGKKTIKQLVKDLNSMGTTNIKKGIEMAYKLVKERKSKNHIAAILLLSDGNDIPDIPVKDYTVIAENFDKNMKDSQNTYVVHSFGLTKEHNEQKLSILAKASGGNFYYINDMNDLSKAFADSVGLLLSAIGRGAYISIFLEKNVEFVEKFGSAWVDANPSFVQKITKEDSSKTSNPSKIGLIRLQYVNAGMDRTFVARVRVNGNNGIKGGRFLIATGMVTFLNFEIPVKVRSEAYYISDGGSKKDIRQVEENLQRVRGGKILIEAQDKARKGDIKGAKNQIETFTMELGNNQMISADFRNRFYSILYPAVIDDLKIAEQTVYILTNEQVAFIGDSFAPSSNSVQKKMVSVLGSSK